VYFSLCKDDEHEPNKTIVCVTASSILAKVLVMNTNYIAQLTSEPSLSTALQQAGIKLEQNVLLCLVDVWLDKVCYQGIHLIFCFSSVCYQYVLLENIYYSKLAE
jgi:hypothetical protein